MSCTATDSYDNASECVFSVTVIPTIRDWGTLVQGVECVLFDCLWLMAADGYTKMNGQVWRYDMKTTEVKAMSPAGMKPIGVKVRPRESVYLPKLDLVFYNGFADSRQIAYDPAKNRWVTLNVKKAFKDLGGVSIGLMYDPKRRLVWAMSSAQRMYVLRIDAGTLEMSEHTEEKG